MILQILAVQYYELRQTHLIHCLHALGYKDTHNQNFTHQTIRPHLQELVDKGLMIRSTQGVKCPEFLWWEAMENLLESGRFSAVAREILGQAPLPSSSWHYSHNRPYQFKKYEEFFRAFQMALLGGASVANIDKVYGSGRSTFVNSPHSGGPCFFLLDTLFKAKLLDKLDSSLLWMALPYLLEEGIDNMIPVRHLMDCYVKHLSGAPDDAKKYKLTEFFLLSGHVDIAIKLMETMQSGKKFELTPTHPAQLGWAETLKGNMNSALDHFNQALALMKKETRKRKIFLPGYEGIFFLFALLKSGEKDNYIVALDHIDTVLKREGEYLFFHPIIGMGPVFQERLGIYSDIEWPICSGASLKRKTPINAFFILLIMSWSDPKGAKGHLPVLKTVEKRLAEAQFPWIEAEVYGLIALLDKGNKKQSNTLHEGLGTISFVESAQPLPKWEKSLNALMQIGQEIKSHPPDKEDVHLHHGQRLVWLLNYNEKYNICSLTPRLQKLSKNGTWTKGRPVALKTLRENYETMEGLTDQDRRVCAGVVAETYYGSYYGDLEYRIDEEISLPALVGHPLVFLEKDLENPIELVKGEPEIIFREDGAGTRISMHPSPGSGQKRLVLVKETPSRFKVIRFMPDHLKIADIIGNKGLKLPQKSREMAARAVSAIASLITVNSDQDLAGSQNGTIKELSADPTPHAHVMPWQEGIKVQFLVRPFGQTGSYYRPGRGGSHVFAEIEGKKAQAVRDIGQEKEKLRGVIKACPTLANLEAVDGEYLVGDSEEALELLMELKTCSDMETLILKWPQGEKMRVRSQVSFNHFSMSIKKDMDYFKATGTLTVDDELALDIKELMTLLETSPLRGRFVTLDDGTFLALTASLKARLEELRAYGAIHGRGVRFNPLAVPAISEFTDQVGSLKSDAAWKAHCKKLKEVIDPEVPGTLRAQLREYQVAGFKWLAQMAHWEMGACLADDMGLGKTVQALAGILGCAAGGPTLVVAPVSVMGNWEEECRNFAPTLTPRRFGPGDRQEFLDQAGPFDLVIASYGLLQSEAEKLSAVKWQTVVLDEAQAIKNAKTKRYKAAMTLTAPFRLITTGTPVENRLEELWTLFNFLNPGLLGSLNRFRQVFAVPMEKDQDMEASRRLKKLIRPFILRRMKSDVLHELPEKTEITLKVEMSEEEALLYEAQRLKSLENIHKGDNGGPGGKHLRILAELTRLRQLCCNPSLVLPDAGIKSSKLTLFGEVVTELIEGNHKALVFSQFVGHLTIIGKFLDDLGISYQYLDGSTSEKDRRERINAFQSGMGDIFLISLKAGGYGLNLTAADYVIHMDPWWNPAVEDQASDRVHRIGQTRPVTIYRLVMKDSIEEQIIKLHREKRELAETLLEGSEAAARISGDELLALLQHK
ncbi:MAG: DEAD/DEAH box helicase [Desulfamplus sp.]|nr:DEAD/DEAH box helicase [Desulfamplus sp.]